MPRLGRFAPALSDWVLQSVLPWNSLTDYKSPSGQTLSDSVTETGEGPRVYTRAPKRSHRHVISTAGVVHFSPSSAVDYQWHRHWPSMRCRNWVSGTRRHCDSADELTRVSTDSRTANPEHRWLKLGRGLLDNSFFIISTITQWVTNPHWAALTETALVTTS